jgi:hypothetical protein
MAGRPLLCKSPVFRRLRIKLSDVRNLRLPVEFVVLQVAIPRIERSLSSASNGRCTLESRLAVRTQFNVSSGSISDIQNAQWDANVRKSPNLEGTPSRARLNHRLGRLLACESHN